MLDLRRLIDEYFLYTQSTNLEIYKAFSLQHELGIFLRDNIKGYWIQFEKNVSCLTADSKTTKKEIDIAIFNEEI